MVRSQETGIRSQGWKGAAALRACGPHPMSAAGCEAAAAPFHNLIPEF